tara:strand:+ start:2147 stop:2380 length:234 start_codon:yes stop_codon:yes gene_type:complete
MFEIKLKNNKTFTCDKDSTIFEAAKKNNIVLKQQIDSENTQVYACRSNDMINSAKELFFKNNLKENNFFSDAFVQTN